MIISSTNIFALEFLVKEYGFYNKDSTFGYFPLWNVYNWKNKLLDFYWRTSQLCIVRILKIVLPMPFSSVQSLSRVWLFATPWISARQASLSITNSWSISNLCPSSRWCHPAISSSVTTFSSCPQSLPASGSFLMSHLISWGGQSTGVSASASVLPMNTQDWSPLGWTGWISLQPKPLLTLISMLISLSFCSPFGETLSSLQRPIQMSSSPKDS